MNHPRKWYNKLTERSRQVPNHMAGLQNHFNIYAEVLTKPRIRCFTPPCIKPAEAMFLNVKFIQKEFRTL